MDKQSDRQQVKHKNSSTAAETQASRKGDGPATKRVDSNFEDSNDEEVAESGSEESEDDEEEESEESSEDDDPNKQKFMRKPPSASDFNPDGTLKFQPKSKLLLKIDQLGDALDADEDDVDNSFGEEESDEETSDEEEQEEDGEEMSPVRGQESAAAELVDNAGEDDQEEKSDAEGSAGEGEEDEEEDEDEEDSPALKKEKEVKPVAKAAGQQKEEPPAKKKKLRRNVVNVYCTEYDVVPKSAKKVFNCRLRYYEEDHDGALNEYGEGGQRLSTDWDLTWHDLSISADFLSKMAAYQKVNQYPGIYVLSRKHNLARNLMKMQRSFPDEYDFFPKTWIIPQENSDFRKQFHDKDGKPLKKKKTYIVKPDGLSQGQGIYLSRNCERIINQCTKDGGYVVQEYLDKPHLVDDLKYDLRIYVLVYGLNPLRVYIHEQGIARFATEPYVAPRPSNINNLYMHLTNYAINKNNSAFMQNQGGGSCESEGEDESEEESGHKRSLHAILKILMQQGADPDLIMEKIKDIIVKTVIVGQPYMAHIYRSCQPDDYDNSMCFQILGFDIMIDRHFRPWLIEVNQSPSFATDSALDYEVKKNVIQDAFKLVNISQERREEMVREKQRQTEERILTGKQEKLDPLKKQEIKEERLRKRFALENAQMRCGAGNNYELLFPSLLEEERNQKYEMLLKKANDNWDEFTCGAKGKRKAQEMEEQNKKAELAAKKLQRSKERKFQDRAQKKNPQKVSQRLVEGTNKEKLVPVLGRTPTGVKPEDLGGQSNMTGQTTSNQPKPQTDIDKQKVSNVSNVPGTTTAEAAGSVLGRQSQQSQATEGNNGQPRHHRNNNDQKMAHHPQPLASQTDVGRHPNIRTDTRQHQLVQVLKQGPASNAIPVQAQSTCIDDLLSQHYGESDKRHKHHQSEVTQAAEPKGKSAVHPQPGSVLSHQMFQVSKQQNPTTRMQQIHENIQQMHMQGLPKQNQQALAPLQNGIQGAQTKTPMCRTQTGFQISSQGNYANKNQLNDHENRQFESHNGVQRRLLESHAKDKRPKQSSITNHNQMLSAEFTPSEMIANSFSKTKYGAQNSSQINQINDLGLTNTVTKSSPPGMSLGEGNVFKSFGNESQKQASRHITSTGQKVHQNLKAHSQGIKQNRQLVTSQQDQDLVKLQTAQSQDETSSAMAAGQQKSRLGQTMKQYHVTTSLGHHQQASRIAYIQNQNNIFNVNDTPKQGSPGGFKTTIQQREEGPHAPSQKQLYSAQSYSHKAGQKNLFAVNPIDQDVNNASGQYAQSPSVHEIDQLKKQAQHQIHRTPQTKLVANKFPGLITRHQGPNNTLDMNKNQYYQNGLFTDNSMQLQVIPPGKQPPQFMIGRGAGPKLMLNQGQIQNGTAFQTNQNGTWQKDNYQYKGNLFQSQSKSLHRVSGNLTRQANAAQDSGSNPPAMPGRPMMSQEGINCLKQQNGQIRNTINLSTNNMNGKGAKPIFINQSQISNEMPIDNSKQKAVVTSNGVISNESAIPIVSASYNYAQQMIPSSANGPADNYTYMRQQIEANAQQLQKIPQQFMNNGADKRVVGMRGQLIQMNQQKLTSIGTVSQNQQNYCMNNTSNKLHDANKNHLGYSSGNSRTTPKASQRQGSSYKVNMHRKVANGSMASAQNGNGIPAHNLSKHNQKQSQSSIVKVEVQVNQQNKQTQLVKNPKQIENKTVFFVPQGSNFNPNRRTCAGRKIA